MTHHHHLPPATRTAATLLCLAALLAACGAPPPGPDAGATRASTADAQRIAASIPSAGMDLSVPDAATVFAEAPAPAAAPTALDKAQAPANATLTPAQESTAMPMPGQANTHSTPSTKPGAP